MWYLLYMIRYFGRITMMVYVHMWSHTLNYIKFLVTDTHNKYGSPIKNNYRGTHCGEFILCNIYYVLSILSCTDKFFINAHNFWSTVWVAH